jgi:hypothetical protein
MSERSDNEVRVPGESAGASYRRRRRWFVDFETTIVNREGMLVACTVYDLSPRGAGVGVPERHVFQVRDQIEFDLPGYGVIVAEVRYRGRGYLGLEFLLEDEEEDETGIARHLVAMEQNRRAEGREMKLAGKLRTAGVDAPCTVLDISRRGAQLMVEETRHLAEGEEVTLELRGVGAIAARVSYLDYREVGLAFLERLESDPGELIAHGESTL